MKRHDAVPGKPRREKEVSQEVGPPLELDAGAIIPAPGQPRQDQGAGMDLTNLAGHAQVPSGAFAALKQEDNVAPQGEPSSAPKSGDLASRPREISAPQPNGLSLSKTESSGTTGSRDRSVEGPIKSGSAEGRQILPHKGDGTTNLPTQDATPADGKGSAAPGKIVAGEKGARLMSDALMAAVAVNGAPNRSPGGAGQDKSRSRGTPALTPPPTQGTGTGTTAAHGASAMLLVEPKETTKGNPSDAGPGTGGHHTGSRPEHGLPAEELFEQQTEPRRPGVHAFHRAPPSVVNLNLGSVAPSEAASRAATGASQPHARLDSLRYWIRGAVKQLSVRGQDHLSVVVRPDSETEFTIEVKRGKAGIELQARLERGNARRLESHWSRLQDALSLQHIKVKPLLLGAGVDAGSFDLGGRSGRHPGPPPGRDSGTESMGERGIRDLGRPSGRHDGGHRVPTVAPPEGWVQWA